MASFVIKKIGEGEKAWSWEYVDGLDLEIKPVAYTKPEISNILKGLKNDSAYEVNEGKTLAIFYVAKGGQQLAGWKMENNPIEKLLNEFKNAEIRYKNLEDDPEYDPNNIKKDMQNNMGTGISGS